MRSLTLAAPFVLLLTGACLYAGDPPQPTMDEMMAAWQRAATPGAEHEALGAFVGTWNAEVRMWMDPDAPPSVSSGSMTTRWAFDGHHLEQQYTGVVEGMPFSGLGLMGYDVAGGKYWGTWVDNMSTSLMSSTGTRSADGKTYTFEAWNTDPMTGKPSKGEEVLSLHGPDHQTMTMWEFKGGKKTKTMEIAYTRAK